MKKPSIWCARPCRKPRRSNSRSLKVDFERAKWKTAPRNLPVVFLKDTAAILMQIILGLREVPSWASSVRSTTPKLMCSRISQWYTFFLSLCRSWDVMFLNLRYNQHLLFAFVRLWNFFLPIFQPQFLCLYYMEATGQLALLEDQICNWLRSYFESCNSLNTDYVIRAAALDWSNQPVLIFAQF